MSPDDAAEPVVQKSMNVAEGDRKADEKADRKEDREGARTKAADVAAEDMGDTGMGMVEEWVALGGPECGSDEMEMDGVCLSKEEAKALIEEASDEAVEEMIHQQDPAAQVEAQRRYTEIQEQRIQAAVEDTEEIKRIIEKKKEEGTL